MAILSKGTTFANNDQVTSTKLNDLVDAAGFVPGAAGTTDDATLQVNGAGRLAVKVIQTANLADSAVNASKLATDAVTTAKVANGAITTAKLADSTGDADGVTTAKLASNAVTTAKLANTAVTAAKLSGAQAGNAPVFGVRAWVVFDPNKNTSNVDDSSNTERRLVGSGNVTSVTKLGTGRFRVNLTTAMDDDKYAVSVTAGGGSSASTLIFGNEYSGRTASQFFLSFAINTDGSSSGELRNPSHLTSVMVIR